jgi:hypothetical protein
MVGDQIGQFSIMESGESRSCEKGVEADGIALLCGAAAAHGRQTHTIRPHSRNLYLEKLCRSRNPHPPLCAGLKKSFVYWTRCVTYFLHTGLKTSTSIHAQPSTGAFGYFPARFGAPRHQLRSVQPCATIRRFFDFKVTFI